MRFVPECCSASLGENHTTEVCACLGQISQIHCASSGCKLHSHRCMFSLLHFLKKSLVPSENWSLCLSYRDKGVSLFMVFGAKSETGLISEIPLNLTAPKRATVAATVNSPSILARAGTTYSCLTKLAG